MMIENKNATTKRVLPAAVQLLHVDVLQVYMWQIAEPCYVMCDCGTRCCAVACGCCYSCSADVAWWFELRCGIVMSFVVVNEHIELSVAANL